MRLRQVDVLAHERAAGDENRERAQNIGERDMRLLAEDRALLVSEIVALYAQEPKLRDMRPSIVRGYLNPPQSPEECIFSKTTDCLSADLHKEITPCQFGGDPDCTQCGCLASVALDMVGRHRLGRVIPVRSILGGSLSIGRRVRRFRESRTVA